MKKILHIINDYNHTKVHRNLINEISKSNINQQVFVPVKNKGFVGRNELQSDKVMFCYSEKLKNYHRFLFKSKINYLYEDLIRQVDVDQVSIIHASTLFSDGFLAYKLNRKFDVPYIVSVRGTDIFTFYKYRKDLLSKMNSVLKHSKKIVFISESNKRAFEELKFVDHQKFRNKYIVINNGIDDFWLENRLDYQVRKNEVKKCLYVGTFNKRKNVLNLITAVKELISKGIKIKLTLVGDKGEYLSKVKMLSDEFDWISYQGYISDKTQLRKLYLENDYFTLVSHHETFGLVYLEALTQGLPLLYTKGQGIDGITKLRIGESVNSDDINDIKEKLSMLFETDYQEINRFNFDRLYWRNISNQYLKIYESY